MIVLGFQLTVELILILPFGGIVRTMQRNSDPWSRRVTSELLSTKSWVFFSEEKEASEGNVTLALALITVGCSDKCNLFTGSSGINAAELGCWVLKTWASAFPRVLLFCSCQGKRSIHVMLISPADIKQRSQLKKPSIPERKITNLTLTTMHKRIQFQTILKLGWQLLQIVLWLRIYNVVFLSRFQILNKILANQTERKNQLNIH